MQRPSGQRKHDAFEEQREGGMPGAQKWEEVIQVIQRSQWARSVCGLTRDTPRVSLAHCVLQGGIVQGPGSALTTGAGVKSRLSYGHVYLSTCCSAPQ